MIEGIFFMLGLGALCGLILGAASRIFYVYEDPRIAEVEACFAGANCGGCGYAGCSAAAVAVVTGKALPSVCIVGGPESATKAAAVMGMEVGLAEPPKSYNECSGGNRASNKYHYLGINSCRALATLYGGQRDCAKNVSDAERVNKPVQKISFASGHHLSG
jgi:Na+-translocating ferredoxin:NAD+ oxidoreductase RNF subunit RnfB